LEVLFFMFVFFIFDHEKPRDVVPLPFEEIRRDGRIHAAR